MDSTLALGAFRIARGAGGEGVDVNGNLVEREKGDVWNRNSCVLIDYRLWAAKSEGRAFDNLIWVLPRIWCNSRRLGDRCEVKRRVWKDASAQEREARTAKHLALESFQAVDLSFHLAVAPGSLHSGQDRREVLLKTHGEARDRPDP